MSNLLAAKPLKISSDIYFLRKFYDKLSKEIKIFETLGIEIENIDSVLCTSILKYTTLDFLNM